MTRLLVLPHVYGAPREVMAADQVVMLKTLRCAVRVVWVYRKTQWVALMTTDLTLSVAQIIEYYAARWKIESEFREIKQEIGSAHSQTCNPDAVTNHHAAGRMMKIGNFSWRAYWPLS